jgi:hypothetical protein
MSDPESLRVEILRQILEILKSMKLTLDKIWLIYDELYGHAEESRDPVPTDVPGPTETEQNTPP